MSLLMKSIDTMKASRDANPALSNADIVTHVNALNALFPDATHFTVASYQNNFGFYSISKINEWFDAIHAVGKKVFFRPALGSKMPDGTTNWSTSADLITICQASVHNFNWQNGDSWDVIPESNPLSATYTNVAGWNQWVRDMIAALDTEFAGIGKTVEHNLFSGTDQTAIFNSRIEAATLTAMGNKICIDFYPMDVGTTATKVANLIGELSTLHTNYPTADIYITETGYNNTTLANDSDQREVIRLLCNEIQKVSYIKGLNYWCASGNVAFDKTFIFQSQSLTLPRPAVAVLSEFYTKGICNGRLKII